MEESSQQAAPGVTAEKGAIKKGAGVTAATTATATATASVLQLRLRSLTRQVDKLRAERDAAIVGIPTIREPENPNHQTS